MKIAVVTAQMKSGERGGAENLYLGLVEALRRAGHAADQIVVPVDESSFDAILSSYARCYDLDLSAYDLVVSTKAPTYMVRHPNHVSYLLHTIRVFYDMFEREFGSGTPELHKQREVIHLLDKLGLHPDRVRAHFANGWQTIYRLYDADPFWRGVGFRALHHPPALAGFRAPRPGEYVFLPGRLHRWKRADLVIRAVRSLKRDIQLKISGTGEDEPMLRELAAADPRIEFLGQVSDGELLDLYAGALVVPFVPLYEDYGLVTVEAFLSQKPVITCVDSGEPARLVKDSETGFIVEPSPQALADRIEFLSEHPLEAAAMGRKGHASVQDINWESLSNALVGAPPDSRQSPVVTAAKAQDQDAPTKTECRVTVLDMQPIDPPVGGGRQRLLGLYHALGEDMPTTYVGTYDWPGEKYRRYRHSATLEEITIPLGDAHFSAAAEWQARAGGKNVVDVSFDLLAHLSPDYANAARAQTGEADIVVFSHPWIYPQVKQELRAHPQLVVYDAHNVEGLLRTTLLDDGAFGTQMARHVIALEHELCQSADLILACSHQDRELFHQFYGIPYAKILVVPNGTFTRSIVPSDERQRQELKNKLGLGPGPVAVFLGSIYPPNVQAAEFIDVSLAPALPEVTFVICGDVGTALSPDQIAPNVRVTGRLAESEKRDYFRSAEIALNPMFSGSGTNVKMFDFMAAGLAIVTTEVGARGIRSAADTPHEVCPASEFAPTIRRLLADGKRAEELRQSARRAVEEVYSWERISAQAGRLLRRAFFKLHEPRPFFSVLIPTYERQELLARVLEGLRSQTYRDFEVIVVDQSQEPWKGYAAYSDLDLFYVHTDVRGVVNARNSAAGAARGNVLAFTDDDCQPLPDWLASAARYFARRGVVGVEGLILSDRRDDPNYRAVTNSGFEGRGFMTANFFLRRETFMALDGFDDRFDHPHFREDTDLGWRALECGEIPFGRDVRVYHPPHLRDVERESHAERNRFFEKDALLLAKHPERYRALFFDEGHYLHTEGFSEHFLRGAEKYRVPLDDLFRYLLRPKKDGDRAKDVPKLRATLEPRASQFQAHRGQTVFVPVRVVNRSNIPFVERGALFGLSYHLRKADGKMLQFDNPRSYLSEPLRPGEERIIELPIVAPHQQGTYQAEIDMVWEGLCWFKRTGNATSLVRLTVCE
ncbi:MAG: glycosyltransferase [Chloroflexi bacterium]|nr:glycosyltransferase [Chloroflexota bacterium]